MMGIDISEELKRTFDLAALRREAAKTLTATEWKELQNIKKTHDDTRRFENRQYEMEYRTRVEVARKRLINQAGAKSKDFKHRWFGQDRFDKAAIHRQAQRNVRNQHHQLMAGIDQQESRAIRQLLDHCEKRTQLRDKPKKDFNQAADRRLSPDRRQAQSRPRGRNR